MSGKLTEEIDVSRDLSPAHNAVRPSAHTAGPWEACQGSDEWPDLHVRTVDENGRYICGLLHNSDTEMERAEAEANARLIAAAPDLLEALTETRRLVSEAAMSGFVDEDAVRALFVNNGAITRAIAKSLGTSVQADREGDSSSSDTLRQSSKGSAPDLGASLDGEA